MSKKHPFFASTVFFRSVFLLYRYILFLVDVTPPRVDSCFSPNPTVSSTFYAEVIWDEPQFSDNSGETPRVERTHAPGLFPRGMTIVIYTAFDESGNNSTCKLEIKVIRKIYMDDIF